MAWTTTALDYSSLDSTFDNIATGLSQLVATVQRVNELSAHPTAAHRSAMALTAQSVVQFASASMTTNVNIPGSTAANIIPLDDTVPQNTEGYSVLTLSFTPKSATSTIVLQVYGYAMCGGTTIYDGAVAALFNDSTAVQAVWLNNVHTASVDHSMNLTMTSVHSAASTTTRTYRLRVGPTTSTGNVSLNGTSGLGRLLGGSSAIILTAMELA